MLETLDFLFNIQTLRTRGNTHVRFQESLFPSFLTGKNVHSKNFERLLSIASNVQKVKVRASFCDSALLSFVAVEA